MKKGKYEIRVKGKLVEIDAAAFALFGYCTLLVHRDYIFPTTWTVSEPRTGMSILTGAKTRKEAINEATQEIVQNYTPEHFHKCVDRWKRVLGGPTTRFEKELQA
jgi:hypothetical protein